MLGHSALNPAADECSGIRAELWAEAGSLRERLRPVRLPAPPGPKTSSDRTERSRWAAVHHDLSVNTGVRFFQVMRSMMPRWVRRIPGIIINSDGGLRACGWRQRSRQCAVVVVLMNEHGPYADSQRTVTAPD